MTVATIPTVGAYPTRLSNREAKVVEAARATMETASLADGKILIGDASNVGAEKTMSGDITMTREGVTSIGANKVTAAKLAAAITPSHVVKYAGKYTSVGGDTAALAISVPGVLATDIVLVTLEAQAAAETIVKAVPSADTVTVTLSADAGAGSIVSYVVLRAIA